MRRSVFGIALAFAGVASPVFASAPSLPPPRDLLARVGFEQRLGATVPPLLEFEDSDGGRETLREMLGGRPTLLVPGYYRCANLCDVVRAGVAQAVAASGVSPGKDLNVVLFSIDPRETRADASRAKHEDAEAHPKAQVLRWRYLTGVRGAPAALARSVGFNYYRDPRTGQYAHAAGIVLLGPRGTITQYLPGVQFAPRTLHLALVAASEGKLGTITDRLLLLCCDYDFGSGHYTLAVRRILQGLGALTLLALAGLFLALRRAEARCTARGAP
ncbi:MAG: SCO family protein [Gammaproteobacteria bacterium]|nr:SCO family protein [Gammaproteobacteria bacterium]